MSLLDWIAAPAAPAPAVTAPAAVAASAVSAVSLDDILAATAAVADAGRAVTALRSEQAASGVEPDGTAGPKTREARSALALVTGNTYPHRVALRAMGGKWDAEAQGWRVPQDRAGEACALVAGVAVAFVGAQRAQAPRPQQAQRPAPRRDGRAQRGPSTVLVEGDTFPVRDALRAMGGRWDRTAKAWRIPADRAADARALVKPLARRDAQRVCRVCHLPRAACPCVGCNCF